MDLLLHFKNHLPAEDEQSANVPKIGGVILAKANTPEFGAGGNTTNRVYGLKKTSGGYRNWFRSSRKRLIG